MQPDKAIAATATMIGRKDARTQAIPERDSLSLAPVMVNKGFSAGLSLPLGRERKPMKTGNSRGNADSDGAGPACAARPAIAGRILGQILLVIVLGEVEFASRRDLGGDAAKTPR